jgi:hypothetical protein
MSAESQNCGASRQPLLGNGSVNTPVSRQRLSSRHVIAATDAYATTEELLDAVLSLRSVRRIYNEDQLPLIVKISGRQSQCDFDLKRVRIPSP